MATTVIATGTNRIRNGGDPLVRVGGSLYAFIIQETSGTAGDILIRKSTNNGVSWDTIATISSVGAFYRTVAACVDSSGFIRFAFICHNTGSFPATRQLYYNGLDPATDTLTFAVGTLVDTLNINTENFYISCCCTSAIWHVFVSDAQVIRAGTRQTVSYYSTKIPSIAWETGFAPFGNTALSYPNCCVQGESTKYPMVAAS